MQDTRKPYARQGANNVMVQAKAEEYLSDEGSVTEPFCMRNMTASSQVDLHPATSRPQTLQEHGAHARFSFQRKGNPDCHQKLSIIFII